MFLNHLLDGDLYKITFISIFSRFFLVFNHNFIVIDFTHIASSTNATDDVTN